MRDLERELRGLEIEWPATPDIAAAIAPRLSEPREPARQRRRNRRWAIGAAVLALLGGVAAVEPARSAILELVGLDGATIERRETPPPPPPARRSALGERLGLGQRVTAAEARRRADFEPAPPTSLPAPGAVYFNAGTPEGVVSYVYAPQPGLPEASETDTGLIVTELVASLERDLLRKVAGPETPVEPVRVEGGRGYWISGQSHAFAFVDSRGRIVFQSERLAGPTLLLQRDGLLIRIEGAIGKERALAIARSIPARR
jgi:hypothetical protein